MKCRSASGTKSSKGSPHQHVISSSRTHLALCRLDLFGAFPIRSLRKAANSSGGTILSTRLCPTTILCSISPGWQSFPSAVIEGIFCNSSSTVQQSSTIFSFPHCLFSPAVLPFWGVCKGTSLPVFPLPSYFAHFSLLIMVSYHTIHPPSITDPSSSLSPSNTNKHLGAGSLLSVCTIYYTCDR